MRSFTSPIFYYDDALDFHPLLPDKFTGIHLTMLRDCIFGSADTIQNSLLQGYIWSETNSNILIEPYGDETRRLEFRPSIIVRRGVWKTEMIGFRHNLGEHTTDEDGVTTVKQLTSIPGITEIYFAGNTDGETEALAGEVFWWFLENRAYIEAFFGLHTYEVGDLAPLQVYEKDFKNVLVTKLNLVYNIWHRYSTSDEGTGE